MENNKEEQPKKTLQELEEEHLSALINCFIFVWQSNPTKSVVKLILDGGENTFYLKKQKFIEFISDILYSTRSPDSLKIIAMIKTSLDDYGNFFMFNKQTQELKQLVSMNDPNNAIKEELSRNNKIEKDKFTEALDMNLNNNLVENDIRSDTKKKVKSIPTKRRYDVGDFRKRFV